MHAFVVGVQVGMTALAGSKALMLFQSSQKYFDAQDSARVGDAISDLRAISETLRTGSVAGMAFTLSEDNNKDVMVGVIRSPEHVAVVVINTDATGSVRPSLLSVCRVFGGQTHTRGCLLVCLVACVRAKSGCCATCTTHAREQRCSHVSLCYPDQRGVDEWMFALFFCFTVCPSLQVLEFGVPRWR